MTNLTIQIERNHTVQPIKFIAWIDGMEFDGQLYGLGRTKRDAQSDLIENAEGFLDDEDFTALVGE